MVFIDKTTQHSQESKLRLDNWKMNFRSNGENLAQLYVKEGQTGTQLWGKLNRRIKKQLRADLKIEQEHICCYCGKQLTSETRIEHYLSKSNKAEFHTRVFNYDNLLLSCEGEYFDKLQYTNGRLETLEEFAIRKNTTIEGIEELNPNKDLTNLNVNDKIRYGKDHCDPYKGQIEVKEKQEIPIVNPTKDRNCWTFFKFNTDGGIVFNDKIEDDSIKKFVENSIRVLNLDAEKLKQERIKAVENFTDELQTLIETFQEDFDINTYFSTKSNSKYPFCFVIYHFIQAY